MLSLPGIFVIRKCLLHQLLDLFQRQGGCLIRRQQLRHIGFQPDPFPFFQVPDGGLEIVSPHVDGNYRYLQVADQFGRGGWQTGAGAHIGIAGLQVEYQNAAPIHTPADVAHQGQIIDEFPRAQTAHLPVGSLAVILKSLQL